jgi:hypothetical protein
LFLEEIKDIPLEAIVYVDESGIDQAIQREHGYAPRGERLHGEVSGKRFVERHSIIAGLCNWEPLAPWTFTGYCNTDVFLTWVKDVLVPELQEGMVVIMDNASFHKSPLIREAIELAGCRLLFLPPYSPDLNPIEQYWSMFKAWLRRMACPLIPILRLVDCFFQDYKKLCA